LYFFRASSIALSHHGDAGAHYFREARIAVELCAGGGGVLARVHVIEVAELRDEALVCGRGRIHEARHRRHQISLADG